MSVPFLVSAAVPIVKPVGAGAPPGLLSGGRQTGHTAGRAPAPRRTGPRPARGLRLATRSATVMRKLLQGIHRFQRSVFSHHEALFQRLVQGQHPEALFITCSDARLSPELLLQTSPGDVFILRNAGNIIPEYGTGPGGEAATIEFALEVLGVQDIVVCGHSHCGAMNALLHPERLRALPATDRWLKLAEPTRRLVAERYAGLDPEHQLNVTVQENVLLQLEALRTHPAAAARLEAGRLNLHGWVYKFETGEVFSFDPDTEQFLPLRAAGYKPAV